MNVATPPATRAPARAARVPSPAESLRAVVRRGLLDYRYAPLVWGGSLGAFGALIALTWPSIEDSVDEIVDVYPEGLREAFNIEGITTIEGYIDAEMLTLIVPLAVAFLAVRSVTRATVGAEGQGWLDTLLAVPLSRGRLVAGSFIVVALVVAAVLAVTTLITLIAGAIAGADPSFWVIARGMANVWPLSMFFAGLAAFLAGLTHKATRVTAIAAGTLIAMYAIDLVGKIADPIEPLRRVSAFNYYGSAIQDGIDPLAFAGLALVGAALAALGALLFQRRDVLA